MLRYRFEEALAFEPPALRLPAPALAFPAVVLVFVDFFALDFLARLVADFADARFADARLPAVAREARGSSSPVSLSATLRALLVTLLPTLVTARVMREIVVRFAMELSPPMSWHKRNLITASSFRGMATSRRQTRHHRQASTHHDERSDGSMTRSGNRPGSLHVETVAR